MPNQFARPDWRLATLITLLFVSMIVLISRLVQLQIVHHDSYLLEAQGSHFDSRAIPGRRGSILDRNGYPLAISVDTFDVYIDRKLWQEAEIASKGEAALYSLLGITGEQIDQALADGPAEVRIASDIPYDLGTQIAAKHLVGVRLLPSSVRAYPSGSMAEPLLGFIGKDKTGLAGLEADYDSELSGAPGRLLYEHDSLGNQIPFGYREIVPPRQGADLILTIDRYIQWLAERELDRAIKENSATGGAIIVIEPSTGAILAMASRPTFDLTQLELNDESIMERLRNRIVTDLYEPGSVFKVITMAAGLNEGVVSPGATYVDTGVAVIDGWPIYNWDFSANGLTTATQVLSKSLNTGSIWVSDLLGPTKFYEYIKKFGFGSATGIGLTGEAEGQVKTPDDIDWSRVDMATNSFGQGINVTPLQMAAAIAAIANDGKLMRPYVVQAVSGAGISQTFVPEAVAQVIQPDTARTLKDMMVQVVDGVAWHPGRVPGYSVAGKTGTAWIAVNGRYDQSRVIASFAGIVPADEPRLAVLVKIDEPKRDQFGTTVAAPAFSRLAQDALRYLGVAPDDSMLVRQTGR